MSTNRSTLKAPKFPAQLLADQPLDLSGPGSGFAGLGLPTPLASHCGAQQHPRSAARTRHGGIPRPTQPDPGRPRHLHRLVPFWLTVASVWRTSCRASTGSGWQNRSRPGTSSSFVARVFPPTRTHNGSHRVHGGSTSRWSLVQHPPSSGGPIRRNHFYDVGILRHPTARARSRH